MFATSQPSAIAERDSGAVVRIVQSRRAVDDKPAAVERDDSEVFGLLSLLKIPFRDDNEGESCTDGDVCLFLCGQWKVSVTQRNIPFVS